MTYHLQTAGLALASEGQVTVWRKPVRPDGRVPEAISTYPCSNVTIPNLPLDKLCVIL